MQEISLYLEMKRNSLLFKIFHLAMPLHCLVILPTSFPSMVTTFKIVNNDLIGKMCTICQKIPKDIHLTYWIPMRWYLKGGSVRPNFSTYDDIWVDHAAIDPHIEVNVPTTAARAEGPLDLQNLGACLVLDHESGGRWRWWRQWWWRWWRSWHEIAQIATITKHNLKTFFDGVP